MKKQGRVHDMIAIVTGAGSGIGRATAILLVQEGATSIVVDIDKTVAKAVVEEINCDCLGTIATVK